MTGQNQRRALNLMGIIGNDGEKKKKKKEKGFQE